MIDPDKCNAVYHLHHEGMAVREISRRLNISRNTVRRIIKQKGVGSPSQREDKIQIDRELLERLYRDCEHWIQRVHEKLVEEEGIQIGYSTLTRLLSQLGITKPPKTRCDRVPDVPGEEMQHDTTVYQVKLSGQKTKVIASLLYLRYSKRKYLKFYRVFNRFAMKCFLHEALMYWGYSAKQCIIDNTNLARLRGTGKNAVIVPEMVSFGRQYGFDFICHAINHPNRKAGDERGFWTTETNFLPGRSFESLEDLNRQALEWATVRMEHRPLAKTGLIPAKAFEQEHHSLTELFPQLPAPYRVHERETDQYGYVALNANYYWVPGSKRERVKVLEYAGCMKIYQRRQCLAEYPLPSDGVKNASFSPEGEPKPRHQPKSRRRGSEQEEKRLHAMGPEVAAYVDYVIKTPGVQRHRFVRELFALSRNVTEGVFVEAVQRALRYRILDMATVHRIAWLCMSQGEERLFDVDVDDSYHERPAYQEGCLTDEPDLSIYDDMLQSDDETDEPEEDPESEEEHE
ncbi:MAG: helix-turn-helix domain-containing protein [Deltaproteobacteria bacterium]|nr:helix-turn-helix domain-containing protein [Deltaproteobacteria bacterium]